MKKLFTILLTAIIAATALVACSEDKTPVDNSSVSAPAEVDVKALETKAATLTKATDTTVRSADDVFNDIGIDPASFEEGFWLIDSTITVETVAFYKAKDAAGAEAIKKLLENYVKSVLNQQENYNVENYNMANTAKIAVIGNYAYMVMSPNVDSIVAEISNAIKG